jgi:phosphoribosylanthranilate isomerase
MKIKVCGMRNTENIKELIKLQPDFIGFIFHENSSRNVTEKLSINISEKINKVGVFVNESEVFIQTKIQNYKLNSVQLHGSEFPQFCKEIKALGHTVIKAFNIHADFNFELLKAYEPYCDYFLFDAFGKKAGGNGVTFNWDLLSKYKGETPFLLSGGIDETMIEQIKNFKHPRFMGVDINSKFETADAYKNINKIKLFKDELFS